MDAQGKIGILSDAAKYDASCSTSGSARPNFPGGLGNGAVAGICHAWSDDGRCVALLKVLLTNACAWNCAYCPNRSSNDIPRASFEPGELVRLAMDFYRRNYIEGLFLSSGVPDGADATMERLLYVARALRTRERFNGYIHMKAIPGASPGLVLEAARWVDRLSVNIELPSSRSLALLAPDKRPSDIFSPMRTIARATGHEVRTLAGVDGKLLLPPASGETAVMKGPERAPGATLAAECQPGYGHASVLEARRERMRRRDPASSLLPAGQTTQMIVGASPESDLEILVLSERLYLAYDVRRVYYSAYIPVNQDARLPAGGKPPLLREHRLYQADWLFRFYGFAASELLDPSHPFLDDGLDPKSSWALRHPERFPVDVAKAPYEELLRVPGIGPQSARRIVRARREGSIAADGLSSLGVVMKRARWFVEANGRKPDTGTGRYAPYGGMPVAGSSSASQLEFDWTAP